LPGCLTLALLISKRGRKFREKLSAVIPSSRFVVVDAAPILKGEFTLSRRKYARRTFPGIDDTDWTDV
jgi:hypothetical protein